MNDNSHAVTKETGLRPLKGTQISANSTKWKGGEE